MNYREIERGCQTSFDFGGQFWHCFTSGKNTDILFVCDEHFVFAMNVVAQGAFLFKDRVGSIAFELMNNHFHYILSGAETDILEFFNFIKKRISREIPKAAKLQLQYKPAADLQTLRNNIVYVNRNGYVANPNYTPFSYPWGTGRYYFNISPHEGDIEDLTVTKLREMMHGRALPFPKDWRYLDGYITPDSYCRLQFGMSLFRDAHHYFSMVSKNVEAYSGIAVDLDDGEFLTDQELFSEVLKILRSRYDGARLTSLSSAQKLDLARILHYDYRSSNGQVRRVLGLSQFEVDSLFPLTKIDFFD